MSNLLFTGYVLRFTERKKNRHYQQEYRQIWMLNKWDLKYKIKKYVIVLLFLAAGGGIASSTLQADGWELQSINKSLPENKLRTREEENKNIPFSLQNKKSNQTLWLNIYIYIFATYSMKGYLLPFFLGTSKWCNC